MGKVYDALRKAEAQRSDGLGVTARTADVRPGRTTAGPQSPTAGALSRWMRWVRGAEGSVEEGGDSVNKRRIALLQPNSFVAEQFRSLRARLDGLSTERPLRILAVTSALPGEGKTTAAVNLAIVSSMVGGRRVLLIDCDLRKPKVHTALGLRPDYGLAEVLSDDVPPERAILKAEGCDLSVLPVRGAPANPSELLASPRMRSLLEVLSRSYDQIILDTPPTLALPDAKSLSEIADGLLLVVKADETSTEDLEATLDVLDRRRICGVVLNGSMDGSQRYGY